MRLTHRIFPSATMEVVCPLSSSTRTSRDTALGCPNIITESGNYYLFRIFTPHILQPLVTRTTVVSDADFSWWFSENAEHRPFSCRFIHQNMACVW
ncbi:hypothetical protein PISMIDRAFT_265580 [Pisolithus microcarpus 441]|uniref:Uncharacterized protein n=1 Tax=Pisolithus microcarpus 441 TaxID=765257 RepID=A0A0C9YRJ6_9AGAM|nr:hypothetical protein PISMIDRAFT_265580 [Pisolithus microcarpus 441]